MLEVLVTTALTSATGRLVSRLVAGQDVGRDDAASVVVAVLQAVVGSQQKTDTTMARLEEKIDQSLENPYAQAMSAGQTLLRDAANFSLRPDQRNQLLADARAQFANAKGAARNSPLEHVSAEVHYGICWLADGALGPPADAWRRAALVLENEMLESFELAKAANLEHERLASGRLTTQERFRKLFVSQSI